jgi:hypothetical protein
MATLLTKNKNHMKNKWHYFTLIILLSQLLTGCVFYYDTAQIDAEFKTTMVKASEYYGELNKEVSNVKKEFNQMNCNESNPIIKQGNIKLETLDKSVTNINVINSKISSEYQDFMLYTSGVKQIGSNTVEWKKLKKTKKNVSSEIKNYENEAKNTLRMASIFQAYLNDSITPNISFIDVPIQKEKYRSSITGIKSQIQTSSDEVKKLEQEVIKIIEVKSVNYPILAEQLTEVLKLTKQNISKLNELIGNAQDSWSRFNSKTIGKERIYSCAEEWEIITQVESEMVDLQRQLSELQEAMKLNNSSIQALVVQMGN